jgi:phosphate transport system substrate-binding protein
MFLRFVIPLSLCLLLGLSAALGQAAELSWQGCGISKLAFMEACAAAYEKQTGTRIRLTGGTSELGIEATASGAADLGGTCRHVLPADGQAAARLSMTIVGWDALTVVVHPSNPINNISREELIRVFQRQTTSWSRLGGPNAPILLVNRYAVNQHGITGDDNLSFRQLICDDFDCRLQPAVIRLPTYAQVEELVERQPLAIAVTGISSARKRRLKILSIDGVLPTREAIAEGVYPFFRPLYMVSRSNARSETQAFVTWMLSDQGQQVIESQGTVSLRQGPRLIRQYAHLPSNSQIRNLDSLRQRSIQVFANQASE